ncbi:hypothetical protein ACVIW2_003483 [Bradyrhizobium huanghuaihaiense]
MKRASADEHRDLLAGVEHLRGTVEFVLARRDTRRTVADTGMQRAMRTGRTFVGFFLEIVGQDERGRGPPGERGPHRSINQMAHLRRRRCLHDVGAGDILEHRNEIEFLLVAPAERVARLLADDCEHRLVIEQRIVEPGDEMRGTGPRGCDADAELAREFRVCGRHERRHLFVPRLHEADLAFRAVHRAEDAVDAVAGITKDMAHAPSMQALDDEVGNGLGHRAWPSVKLREPPVFCDVPDLPEEHEPERSHACPVGFHIG